MSTTQITPPDQLLHGYIEVAGKPVPVNAVWTFEDATVWDDGRIHKIHKLIATSDFPISLLPGTVVTGYFPEFTISLIVSGISKGGTTFYSTGAPKTDPLYHIEELIKKAEQHG